MNQQPTILSSHELPRGNWFWCSFPTFRNSLLPLPSSLFLVVSPSNRSGKFEPRSFTMPGLLNFTIPNVIPEYGIHFGPPRAKYSCKEKGPPHPNMTPARQRVVCIACKIITFNVWINTCCIDKPSSAVYSKLEAPCFVDIKHPSYASSSSLMRTVLSKELPTLLLTLDWRDKSSRASRIMGISIPRLKLEVCWERRYGSRAKYRLASSQLLLNFGTKIPLYQHNLHYGAREFYSREDVVGFGTRSGSRRRESLKSLGSLEVNMPLVLRCRLSTS